MIFASAFVKPSDGDSGGSGSGSTGGSSGGDNPKGASDASGHKTGDSSNEPKHDNFPLKGRIIHKVDKDKGGGGGLTDPGSAPAPVRTDGNGYNNHNIKKFDTTKSLFRIGDGKSSKIIEYMPGFNDTFFNSTLPYCWAVQTGTCYDGYTQKVIS